MSAKAFRPKARRPAGFPDRAGAEARFERDLIAKVSELYEAWGFQPLATPTFEYADALGKFLPDEERPNEGVFALEDEDGQWLSLRYDHTAPLARYVAENFDALPKPYRRFAVGPLWRNEKPGPMRFREFLQCDADSVGASAPAADAEMIALATHVMEIAGLTRDEYVVRVNDRRLLDGVLARIGVPDTDAGRAQRLGVLRAVDKMDRLGPDGVAQLLGEGRMDESGDYTKGAGLDANGVKAVLAFAQAADASSDGDRTKTLTILEGLIDAGGPGAAGLEALTGVDRLLEALGVGADQALFDPGVVRGLGYYTGPVFEAELLFPITNDKGQSVRAGSVGGGGRYDDLVARFRGQEAPATGFSFGVSRFAAALRLAGRLSEEADERLVVILALEPERMADYFALAARLREAGFPAEAYVGSTKNMQKQLKYADKRGARFAVLIGSDEREAGEVTVKDLILGRALAEGIETREEWRAARPAQETIPADRLVEWLNANVGDAALAAAQ